MNTIEFKRVGFAGTPQFAATILEALCDSPYKPVCVYSQPDSRSGRGRKLKQSEVKQSALAHDITVHQPSTLRDPDALAELEALALDVFIVAAYGLILPQRALDAPTHGCINVHASVLPRWRGAAPIQAAIAAGDELTGVTIMQMELGLDTGPMLARQECAIEPHHSGGTLEAELADLGARCLLDSLPRLERGELATSVQDESLACYAHKINKADAELDFTHCARSLERRIRALNPAPIAFTTLADERIRIWRAQALADVVSAPPGTVIRAAKYGIDVATADGVLRLLELQRPGRRAIPAAQFLQSLPLAGGEQFG